MSTSHVIIVGTGFAGIEVAKRLGISTNRKLTIQIINKNLNFEFTPLISEYLTNEIDSAVISRPLADILSPRVSVTIAEVVCINNNSKQVITSEETFSYDYLVIASGAQPAYPIILGADRFTQKLKTIEDANLMRNLLLTELKKDQNIVIIGGGPSGVELAIRLVSYGMEIGHERQVYLVERSPILFPWLNAGQRTVVEQAINQAGIHLVTGIGVQRITKDHVCLDDGSKIISFMTIWASGVQSSCNKFSNIDLSAVSSKLNLEICPEIYIIGDALNANPNNHNKPLAQVAVRQGRLVAKNIIRNIKGKPLRDFNYKVIISLYSLGGSKGVGTIGRLVLKGKIVGLLRCIVYLIALPGLKSKGLYLKSLVLN